MVSCIEGRDLIIVGHEMRKLELDMIHSAFTLLLSYQTKVCYNLFS